MIVEIVEEFNLVELIDKLVNTFTLAACTFALSFFAFTLICFIIYALCNADKEFKVLREKCDILSKRMDNLVDKVNYHD